LNFGVRIGSSKHLQSPVGTLLLVRLASNVVDGIVKPQGNANLARMRCQMPNLAEEAQALGKMLLGVIVTLVLAVCAKQLIKKVGWWS
jgi:hypothetical protein